jgi:hypothetical protein
MTFNVAIVGTAAITTKKVAMGNMRFPEGGMEV